MKKIYLIFSLILFATFSFSQNNTTNDNIKFINYNKQIVTSLNYNIYIYNRYVIYNNDTISTCFISSEDNNVLLTYNNTLLLVYDISNLEKTLTKDIKNKNVDYIINKFIINDNIEIGYIINNDIKWYLIINKNKPEYITFIFNNPILLKKSLINIIENF